MNSATQQGRRSWPSWLQGAALLLVVVALGSPEYLSQWQGRGGSVTFDSIVTVTWLAGAVAALSGVVVLVFLPRRGLQVVGLGLVVVLGGFTAVGLAKLARMRAFADCAERAVPLVAAIEGFEAQHGRPPRDLEELVPRWIVAIPRTGMPAYPLFTYALGKRLANGETVPRWELRVSCGDGLRRDRFCYQPEQQYANDRHRGSVTSVGGWAYIVEY
ncbi:MAG: hypothetical protein NXI31_03100 [bacterium]|nr:hypothetical protein [bacterium]